MMVELKVASSLTSLWGRCTHVLMVNSLRVVMRIRQLCIRVSPNLLSDWKLVYTRLSSTQVGALVSFLCVAGMWKTFRVG